MTVEFVNAGNRDFRALAAELDAYYFSLVGDVQNRYAEPNRPENMDALVVAYQDEKAVAIGAWKRREGNTAEMKRIYETVPRVPFPGPGIRRRKSGSWSSPWNRSTGMRRWICHIVETSPRLWRM